MKAELNINTQEIVREIANEVIKAIKPLLLEGKKNLIYRHNSGTEGK